MKRNILNTLIIIFLITINLNAQETIFPRVPKQYSFEFGYRNLFGQSNFINNSTHGYGALFDYAWQLSGFDGKKAKAFITVPMGYTVLMPDNANSRQINMLNYGWTVRHELTRHPKVVPYLGYGLLLNNMRINGTKGSLFGHQTQFEFGVNLNTKTRLKYFAKIEYSYTSYPQLNEPERIRLHYLDFRAGARF